MVFQLRLLQEKLESNQELTKEEVVNLEQLEEELVSPAFGRKYKRLDLKISAMLRHPDRDSIVHVLDLGPGGIRIRGCTQFSNGERVELHLRENNEHSYRFQALVMWHFAQGDEYTAGLGFLGKPVLLNLPEGQQINEHTEGKSQVA